ncbi:MAG: hypothetical protein IJ368_09845 [Oscillospiraceae bacterium]|nr:hypothetical protein [Oscillospiraceae bacterium]
MSGFSDKYKNALDDMEISSDFKERTAKKMAEIRDNQPKRFIVSRRTITSVTAAAACIAAVFSLSRAGVFEKDSQPAVIEAGTSPTVTEAITTAETELTEITDEIIETVAHDHAIPEAAAEAPVTTAAAEQTVYTSQPPAQTTAVITTAAETQPEFTYLPQTIAAEESIAAYTPPAITSAVTDEAEIYSPITTSPNLIISANDTADEADSPADNDMGFIGESSAKMEAIDAAPIQDSYDGGIAIAGAGGKARSFSPRDTVSVFKAAESSAVITFYDTQSAVSDSVKVRSIKKLKQLMEMLYSYTDEKEAAYLTEAPSDINSTINFADEQGNALRVFTGTDYICFEAAEPDCTAYYKYTLTADELSHLGEFLSELT